MILTTNSSKFKEFEATKRIGMPAMVNADTLAVPETSRLEDTDAPPVNVHNPVMVWSMLREAGPLV